MSLEEGHALFSHDWSLEERHLHINLLELRAVRLTLQSLTTTVAGKVVLVRCDNTTAVSHINKQGGTHSWSLIKETLLLYDWALANRVTLKATHWRGEINVLADFLSRNRPDPTEWSLNDRLCSRLFQRWGRPMVDLFASPQNHKLPLWFSRVPHPEAAAVDAFSQTWSGWSVYAFPPFNLILDLLIKLRSDQVEEAIVVLPFWPRRSWFPLLLEMSCTDPLRLPCRMDLLQQTLPLRGTLFHPELQMLQLTAWKLNAKAGKQPASLAMLSLLRSLPSGHQLGRSTTLGGRRSALGALTDTSIRFQYL
jgi:hypothetical protein